MQHVMFLCTFGLSKSDVILQRTLVNFTSALIAKQFHVTQTIHY